MSGSSRNGRVPVWARLLGPAAFLALVLLTGRTVLLLLAPSIAQHTPTPLATCVGNSRRIGNALRMYVEDYDGYTPPAASWQDGLQTYLMSSWAFKCPSRRNMVDSYAYNVRGSALVAARVPRPAQAPMFFESTLGRHNGADYLRSFTTPHDDHTLGLVGFLDGHASVVGGAPASDAGFH